MSDGQHDHDRPSIADMRAALATFRAVLDGGFGDGTAHQAAEGGSCPACTAVAAASFGCTAASAMAGDTAFVSEPVRLQLLALVDAAERELDTGLN